MMFAPFRRFVLQLLAGASAAAMARMARTITGFTLQDFADNLPLLPQATLYSARKVITMDPGTPEADAVVVVGERVLFVGPLAEVAARLGDQPYTLDDACKDKIILAGMVDQHVHPVLAALTMTLDTIAIEDWVPPTGTSKAAFNQADHLARLTAAEAALADPNDRLITWGCHHWFHGLIRRAQLQAISPTRPILVWHRSAHAVILNTPHTGSFGHHARVCGHPAARGLGAVQPRRRLFLRDRLFRDHAQAGPAARDARTSDGAAGVDARLPAPLGHHLGVWACVDPADAGQAVCRCAIYSHLMQMRDGHTDGHKGERIMELDVFNPASDAYFAADYQIHVHQNGDAGLDMVLDAPDRNTRRQPRADHRTTIVRFGYPRRDQVDRLAYLGAIVCANPYYLTALSNRHGKIVLGTARADERVPVGDVVARSVPLSFHSALPMASAQPLFRVWAAVACTTVSGRVAGPEQRLPVDQALRAVTIGAAQSLRLEAVIGSITPGKSANFSILEADPFEVAPAAIKDIGVWGTAVEGGIYPVPPPAPIKKASLFGPLQPQRVQPLDALALVAPIAGRGSFGSCGCCAAPQSSTCGPDAAARTISMGFCSTNALGWAVAAERAAVA